GANDYREWSGRIPGVDILAARLPGRDSRFNETPATEFEPLLEHLLAEITPYLDTPFCLFGHSMGGLFAYELGRRLEERGHAPELVVASGTTAPQMLSRLRRFPAPSDDVLLAELREDGIATAELLANKELMRLLLPILRADLAVVADYRYDTSVPPLRAPLALYYGEDEVPDAERLVREWALSAAAPPRAHRFPGGHFFVRTARDAVIGQLVRDLTQREAAR
ncbi:alpha/beta fold hydrolase, partial [Streptomyces sp900116325]|uniref:thioesterase II family protein n=1 Tax=Streptomyces sp. 900116325 TaxID=3154295 RepID=UPI0033FC33BF